MSVYAPDDPFAPLESGGSHSRPVQDEELDDWQPLPLSAHAPEPPCTFANLGAPSMRFAYHHASGELAGYVLRFETATGKTFRPLRYGRFGGRIGWHCKGWTGDNARPLYHLPNLLTAAQIPVLLCEGEKSADAAARLLGPSWTVIASMNGAESPQRTDWSPLAGRDLVIWPDNDASGRAYVRIVAALALAAGANSVRIVDVPVGLPECWDLADPVPEGMQLDPAALLRTAPAFEPDSEEQGGFRVQRRQAGGLGPGLYYATVEKDPDTHERRPTWHRFGSRLDVLAYTRDGDSREWGRYLAVHDGDGKVHRIAMAMSAMAGDGAEYRRVLFDHGFVVGQGRTANDKLESYLKTWEPRCRVLCVARIGWHGPRFVLPDRTFGPGGETVVLQGERPAKFTVGGTLTGWQSLVATPAVGNSRLAFSIAASFAGPLLKPLSQESGGFHFKGGSSIGKTTILHAARSTWGCPLGSWRTTDNAAEATAAGASDTLHLLDEVSQADGRAVDAMAYMLGNGTGKGRASRNGAAHEVTTWRVLFLSTGELSLNDKIAEAGKRARAGQSVRVIDIPADAGKGLGAFDTLHGVANGAVLADQLRRAGEANSGHAARAFLEQITDDVSATVEVLRDYMEAWLAANTPANSDGQVERVAARFALVAAAGELAIALGILPWPEGEASAAAARCFGDWLAARGDNGPEEVVAGLRQVRSYLEMHGTSRFEEAWPRDTRTGLDISAETEVALRRTINRAGFRRLEQDGQGENWEYFVLPEAWRSEMCLGLDAGTIAKAMIAKGWMKAGEGRHLTRSVRVPGVGKTRLYCITSGFLAGDEA